MREPISFGDYLLLDRIAVGGMAEIFAAVRPGDPEGRLVAVKRLLPTLAEEPDLVRMFLDEARLVVQLEHPGIPPVLDLGKIGEGYYLAMEYRPGKDLRALLDRLRGLGEPLAVPVAAHVAARVAEALDHAHRSRGPGGAELKIVHRDVSPANVLLGFDGSVGVIDFGIALADDRSRRADAVLRGKFGYMSPEMVRALPVDRRSDVFALGAVLHEMLTGARLFAGGSEQQVLERVRSADVPPPSRSRPGLPRALDAVVLRALAREPAHRWGWASELALALGPFTGDVGPGDGARAVAALLARCFPEDLGREREREARARALARGE